MLMSITLLLLGVLLASDLRRAPRPVLPTLLAATVLGAYGSTVAAVALALAPTDATSDPWGRAGTVAIGGVLVQTVAHLVGTGLGLLLRPVVVADLATIVLPLGVWLILGIVLPAAQAFTPYAAAQNLLAGRMDIAAWLQWLAVVLIWPCGLNIAGAARLRRL